MVRLYGIRNCDSVKQGRAWLDAQGEACAFHDFKKQGLPADRLDAWLQAVGWERLLNRQGTTWRKLAPEVQAGVADTSSARVLMLAQPSLVKRPVVEWPDGRITVGLGGWARP